MLFPLRRCVALACAVLIVPFAAAAAAPETPSPSAAPKGEQAAQQPAPETPDDTAVADDKRICRHVRLDASSRRKTKVCRTTEEWRELNNPR